MPFSLIIIYINIIKMPGRRSRAGSSLALTRASMSGGLPTQVGLSYSKSRTSANLNKYNTVKNDNINNNIIVNKINNENTSYLFSIRGLLHEVIKETNQIRLIFNEYDNHEIIRFTDRPLYNVKKINLSQFSSYWNENEFLSYTKNKDYPNAVISQFEDSNSQYILEIKDIRVDTIVDITITFIDDITNISFQEGEEINIVLDNLHEHTSKTNEPSYLFSLYEKLEFIDLSHNYFDIEVINPIIQFSDSPYRIVKNIDSNNINKFIELWDLSGTFNLSNPNAAVFIEDYMDAFIIKITNVEFLDDTHITHLPLDTSNISLRFHFELLYHSGTFDTFINGETHKYIEIVIDNFFDDIVSFVKNRTEDVKEAYKTIKDSTIVRNIVRFTNGLVHTVETGIDNWMYNIEIAEGVLEIIAVLTEQLVDVDWGEFGEQLIDPGIWWRNIKEEINKMNLQAGGVPLLVTIILVKIIFFYEYRDNNDKSKIDPEALKKDILKQSIGAWGGPAVEFIAILIEQIKTAQENPSSQCNQNVITKQIACNLRQQRYINTETQKNLTKKIAGKGLSELSKQILKRGETLLNQELIKLMMKIFIKLLTA
jgi:hypothetical protein